MFDMSMGELVVIGVIALIVIGPERLPKVARTVGHLLGRAQRYVNDVKGDIRREIELDELRKFKSEMEDAAQTVHTSMRDTTESLREPAQALRQELDDAAKAASGALSLSTPVVDEDGQPAHVDTPAETAAGSTAGTSADIAAAALTDPAATAPAAAQPATGAAAIVGADPAAGTRVETGALPATAVASAAPASPSLTIPAEVAGKPRVAAAPAAATAPAATAAPVQSPTGTPT